MPCEADAFPSRHCHAFGMRASGVFRIESWDANGRAVDVTTAAPLGGAFIVRVVEGETLRGTSQVLFAGAFNESVGSGTYVAIDAFEGEILGRAGTLNFWHTSTLTRGQFNDADAVLKIVPDSGTGALSGARGSGRIIGGGDDEVLELDIEFDDDADLIDGEAAAGRLEP